MGIVFSKLNAEWRYFKKNFRKKSLSEKRTITGRNEIPDIGQSDYTRKVFWPPRRHRQRS